MLSRATTRTRCGGVLEKKKRFFKGERFRQLTAWQGPCRSCCCHGLRPCALNAEREGLHGSSFVADVCLHALLLLPAACCCQEETRKAIDADGWFHTGGFALPLAPCMLHKLAASTAAHAPRAVQSCRKLSCLCAGGDVKHDANQGRRETLELLGQARASTT